jgi:DNA repair protein RecO (recombination protein O)
MKLLKDEGLVIKKYDYGEADRISVVFTKKHGKLSGIVKGIRKSKKRESASTDILSISDFIFFEKSDKIYISESETKKNLINVTKSSFKTAVIFYVLRCIDIFIQEKQSNTKIYEITLKLLDYIEREDSRENILVSIAYYLFKILKTEGVINEIVGKGLYLNLNELFFEEKIEENSIKLSEREKKFLLCLNKVDIESINRLKFREIEILTLIEIFEKFIMLNIDEKLKIKYFLREDF